MFVRGALVVLIVLVAITAYFAFSAYTAVQAQVTRLAAVEQQFNAAAERVKQIEADLARLRPPAVPGR